MGVDIADVGLFFGAVGSFFLLTAAVDWLLAVVERKHNSGRSTQ